MRDNWKRHKLGSIAVLEYGKNLPIKDLLPFGYPVFGANGIVGYTNRFNISEYTVLVSCRGEYSGKINYAEPKTFVTNNSIPVKLSINFVDNKFLYYFLHLIPKGEIVSGSAQPQVTINDLQKAKIEYPPLPQQRKIAKILSTCDTVIAKTE